MALQGIPQRLDCESLMPTWLLVVIVALLTLLTYVVLLHGHLN